MRATALKIIKFKGEIKMSERLNNINLAYLSKEELKNLCTKELNHHQENKNKPHYYQDGKDFKALQTNLQRCIFYPDCIEVIKRVNDLVETEFTPNIGVHHSNRKPINPVDNRGYTYDNDITKNRYKY